MTLIDKIVHYIYFLLFGPALKFVYSSSKVEIKVTLFCIISILVLLTHIENGQIWFLCPVNFSKKKIYKSQEKEIIRKIWKKKYFSYSWIVRKYFPSDEYYSYSYFLFTNYPKDPQIVPYGIVYLLNQLPWH